MAKTAQELFSEMAKKAGWTDEQVKLALETDEGKELSNGYVRHAEYSSALDKARNLEQKAKKAEEWEGWWQKNAPVIQNLQVERERYKERLVQLGYTDLEATTAANNAAAAAGAQQGLSMQQVQQIIEQRDQNYSSLLRDTMSILARHDSSRYGALDVEALEKTAVEKKLTLRQAYDELIQPKVKELETKELEARIKREREEAVKDYASRNNLPVNPAGAHVPAGFDFTPKTGDEKPKPASDADLLAMWQDAGKSAAA